MVFCVCVCLSGWLDHILVNEECYLSHVFDEQIGLMQEVSHADSFIHRETDNKLGGSSRPPLYASRHSFTTGSVAYICVALSPRAGGAKLIMSSDCSHLRQV